MAGSDADWQRDVRVPIPADALPPQQGCGLVCVPGHDCGGCPQLDGLGGYRPAGPDPARPQPAETAASGDDETHAGWCDRGSWLAAGRPLATGRAKECTCSQDGAEVPDPPAPYRLLGVRAHRGLTGAQLLTVTVECTDPIGGLLVQTLSDRLVIGGGRLLAEYAASGDLDGDLARSRGARSRP